MGLQLVAQTDDFSSIGFGLLGPETSITSGLQGLFSLNADAANAVFNYSSRGSVAPSIVGSPTIDQTGLVTNQTNYVNFNFAPSGDRTVAIVFYVDATAVGFPLSSFTPGDYEYLQITSTDVVLVVNGVSSRIIPKTAGRADMYVIAVKDFASLELYRPRDKISSKVEVGGSQTHSQNYRTGAQSDNSPTKSMLFAYWNRTLTSAEIDTFYAEMKAYLSDFGVATI